MLKAETIKLLFLAAKNMDIAAGLISGLMSLRRNLPCPVSYTHLDVYKRQRTATLELRHGPDSYGRQQ